MRSADSVQPTKSMVQIKGNSNFELGTPICFVYVENYFLTIIKHIADLSSKLEFPFVNLSLKLFNWQSSSHL